MKDQHDKSTPDMITKRGRPPKHGRTMSAAERKAAERNRKAELGMKQVWLDRDTLAIMRDIQRVRAAGDRVDEVTITMLLQAIDELKL